VGDRADPIQAFALIFCRRRSPAAPTSSPAKLAQEDRQFWRAPTQIRPDGAKPCRWPRYNRRSIGSAGVMCRLCLRGSRLNHNEKISTRCWPGNPDPPRREAKAAASSLSSAASRNTPWLEFEPEQVASKRRPVAGRWSVDAAAEERSVEQPAAPPGSQHPGHSPAAVHSPLAADMNVGAVGAETRPGRTEAHAQIGPHPTGTAAASRRQSRHPLPKSTGRRCKPSPCFWRLVRLGCHCSTLSWRQDWVGRQCWTTAGAHLEQPVASSWQPSYRTVMANVEGYGLLVCARIGLLRRQRCPG